MSRVGEALAALRAVNVARAAQEDYDRVLWARDPQGGPDDEWHRLNTETDRRCRAVPAGLRSVLVCDLVAAFDAVRARVRRAS